MTKKAMPKESVSVEKRICCLFAENYTKWLSYAVRHKVKTEDAEDIIQSLSVRLLERKESLPLHGQEAYVMEALKNAIINHFTRTKQFETLQEEFFPAEASTEEIVLESLNREDVRKAVNRLSPVQRDVIHMLYFQHMTVSQIAEKMNMTDNEVRSYKSRAVRALRSILSDMEKEERTT